MRRRAGQDVAASAQNLSNRPPTNHIAIYKLNLGLPQTRPHAGAELAPDLGDCLGWWQYGDWGDRTSAVGRRRDTAMSIDVGVGLGGFGEQRPPTDSSLINRNVIVNGHRTSVRLEPTMWDALAEIARREDGTIHDICSRVDIFRSESTFAAALRVFILSYYRTAATPEGHDLAGHGSDPLQRGSMV